jgi:PTH1 family peptidyl-tRNA hydrolase
VKLLVGLGNPGKKYEETRHNIGFRFLDLLARSEGLRFVAAPRFAAEMVEWVPTDEKILLVKPQTFMNNSGEAIGKLARYYHVETQDIFVVYDDLELPAGKPRIKTGGGHGGHNGLKSLNQHLPNPDYTRIKIGIGRPAIGEVTPWVLGKADEGDRADEARVFDALLSEISTILSGDSANASNHIHQTLNPKD